MNQLKIIKETEILEKQFKIYGDTENPLFLAKDVAEWIEHSQPSVMLKNVDAEEKVMNTIHTLGGNQEAWFLTEDGVYEVLMQSRKPIAKQFKKQIKKILKDIRLYGKYEVPATYADALQLAAEQQRQISLQTKLIEEFKPKADFFDQVASSKDAIEMGQVAKVLNIPGMGRNNLFEFLRNKGILQKNNIPYQKYCDSRHFRVIESKYTTPNGEVKINLKTLVYQKGLGYIRKLIENDKIIKQ